MQIEWMECQPRATQAAVLGYHRGNFKILFASSPWKRSSLSSSQLRTVGLDTHKSQPHRDWAQVPLKCFHITLFRPPQFVRPPKNSTRLYATQYTT